MSESLGGDACEAVQAADSNQQERAGDLRAVSFRGLQAFFKGDAVSPKKHQSAR